MKPVTVHHAKTNLSKLIARAEKGEEVIIARGKKPVAKIVGLEQAKPKREPGFLKGKFELGPEFFEPMTDEELAEWGL